MSEILDNIKNISHNPIKAIITILIVLLVTFFGGWWFISNFEHYSNFAIAFILSTLAVFFLYTIDRWVLNGFNTFDEVKKGNIAAAIAFLGECIIIGACVVAAFSIFH